ncbi:unnamed protein product [Prunus armeniaca]|uniref:Uncharacterized protein n=1 Tax=Prunus armeniaca TaxID=36596 RepID=A0A6J5UZ26_PRUAR|nr:unnamed protein product [Prunus armeniaca]
MDQIALAIHDELACLFRNIEGLSKGGQKVVKGIGSAIYVVVGNLVSGDDRQDAASAHTGNRRTVILGYDVNKYDVDLLNFQLNASILLLCDKEV